MIFYLNLPVALTSGQKKLVAWSINDNFLLQNYAKMLLVFFFSEIHEIVLVMTNYAKHYASTIDLTRDLGFFSPFVSQTKRQKEGVPDQRLQSIKAYPTSYLEQKEEGVPQLS